MTLKITIDGDELYDYVRIDSDDTTETKQVDRMFAASCREIEEFLNTDFSTLDADGNKVEHEAPTPIKDWVFDRTAQRYELRGMLPKAEFTTAYLFRVLPFQ